MLMCVRVCACEIQKAVLCLMQPKSD